MNISQDMKRSITKVAFPYFQGGDSGVICDVGHEKTDIKVFVVVIQKEGRGARSCAHPSIGMTPTF